MHFLHSLYIKQLLEGDFRYASLLSFEVYFSVFVDTSVLFLCFLQDRLEVMELACFLVCSGVWNIKMHGFFPIALSKSTWRLEF